MINAEPTESLIAGAEDAAVEAIVNAGAGGAMVIAAIATAVVVGLWFAFYLVVFVPRSVSP